MRQRRGGAGRGGGRDGQQLGSDVWRGRPTSARAQRRRRGRRCPHYGLLGQDMCTHYLFLVQHLVPLLRLLKVLYKESINLRGRFMVITHSEKKDILQFIKVAGLRLILVNLEVSERMLSILSRLLKTLANALNFTVQISKPRDGEKWGRRLLNGNWTGAMGETMRGETDISFANYFITADRLRIIDMTRPYYIDYTCFITPKPQPLPQYSAVSWPFTGMVWAVVLVTLLIIPPVVLLAGFLEPGEWFRHISNVEFYVVGIFLTRAHPLHLVPSSSGMRILVITNWIAAMVLAVAYKSSLIAFLTVPLQASPVNTLEELLSSGLDWGVRDRGGWDEWFSNSLDPTSRKIAEGFQYVEGIEGGLARVMDGNFAFMNSGTFLRYLVASSYTDEFGETKLHIAKQCFVPFR
ncbi:ionotropic receptor 21a-like [Portunus trituberculatus]|uniref:ionotropic receptor 21a-like n=1 Tax=Portunus trituberculatus TaxID=210409 RepID=UPI001E1CD7A5|nr:ionotropic receptor 21a-like [Portunus trituberculatus]